MRWEERKPERIPYDSRVVTHSDTHPQCFWSLFLIGCPWIDRAGSFEPDGPGWVEDDDGAEVRCWDVRGPGAIAVEAGGRRGGHGSRWSGVVGGRGSGRGQLQARTGDELPKGELEMSSSVSQPCTHCRIGLPSHEPSSPSTRDPCWLGEGEPWSRGEEKWDADGRGEGCSTQAHVRAHASRSSRTEGGRPSGIRL